MSNSVNNFTVTEFYLLNASNEAIEETINYLIEKQDEDPKMRHILIDWFKVTEVDGEVQVDVKCPPLMQRKNRLLEQFPDVWTKMSAPRGTVLNIYRFETDSGITETAIEPGDEQIQRMMA